MERFFKDNELSMQIKKEIQELVNVAKGEIPADLLLCNGKLVNVYIGEILEGLSVAIKGKKISCIGKDLRYTVGSHTQVIELDGMVILPGLIDAHTHILMYSPLHEIVKYAIKGGTTTIITEAIELGFPYGILGIESFLDWIKDQPIKIYSTIPVMHSLSPSSKQKAISLSDLRRLLKNKKVLGLGETIWNYILNWDQRTYEFIAETLSMGKIVEGHGAGAKEKALCAFASSGISSCHESINTSDVLNRLKLGLYAMIREGDIRRELSNISEIGYINIDLRRCILVSDGLAPKTLIKGYMNLILQKAIEVGFDPVKAIQMVTLNPAEHFRLDHLIGGIAPYRYADVVIVPDLKHITPEYVISNGEIVLEKGDIVTKCRVPVYLKSKFSSVSLPLLKPEDFVIYSKNRQKKAKLRVIHLVTPLVTKEEIHEFIAKDGQIEVDLEKDILKVAVLTETNGQMKKFVGLVKGFGLKRGAIATSAVWDACLILVIGADSRDMAEAVNRVVHIGGGIVVSENGKIISELNMPIGGIVSELPATEIAKKMDSIQKSLEHLGSTLPDVHLSVSVLTTPYIPFLRLSEDGIFDLKKCKKLDLFVT